MNEKKKWVSNAKWPSTIQVASGWDNTSSSLHDTEEQAIASCTLVQTVGMYGHGIIFPIKVWHCRVQ